MISAVDSMGIVREQGKLVEMHPYGHTSGFAPVRSPHRLLPALSLQPRLVLGMRPWLYLSQDYTPRLKTSLIGVFTPQCSIRSSGVPRRGRRSGSIRCARRALHLAAQFRSSPQESQIERCENQDDPNIHCQPFPESVSEEREIYTDYDGCHRHQVKEITICLLISVPGSIVRAVSE
jgi:hypothetical protein